MIQKKNLNSKQSSNGEQQIRRGGVQEENKTNSCLFTQHSPAMPTLAGQRRKILKGQNNSFVRDSTHMSVGLTSDHFYFGSLS